MTLSSFILGTRGSRMALIQADMSIELITRAHPGIDCTARVIKTSGDWKPEDGEKRLSESEGGKGLFVKEIEQAILDGSVNAGVHCLKDVPSFLPKGLVVRHVLKRDDPRDVFITRSGDDLMSLPSGSVVGTASMRRQAIIKKLRPDLVVVPLRGNVPTRIDKIKQGMMDAAVLSYAGLNRLGFEVLTSAGMHGTPLDPSVMLPACGQGVVCYEMRENDAETAAILDKIHHAESGLCAEAERTILQILDGSCHTPIGAFATLTDGQMSLKAMVAAVDGTDSYSAERNGAVRTLDDVLAMANDLGHEIRMNAPAGILPQQRTGT